MAGRVAGGEAPGGAAQDASDRALMHLVIRQVNAVTSAMRSSPRWALAAGAPNALLSSATTSTSALSLTRAAYTLARSDAPEADADARNESNVGLLGGFTVLRAQLRLVTKATDLPLPTILTHFLRVVLSARTTGAVTQTVLEALTSFLEHGLFREDSIGLVRGVQEVAHATSHCRFEPSDAGKDEVVLLTILDVMVDLVCGRAHAANGHGAPLVDMLGDRSICEMMETCLSMCCQTRLSTALRRTAEHRMLRMTREIFSRLATMPLEADAAYKGDGRAEPELATLTAEHVGGDGDESRHRMAMPDPKSVHIPSAGLPERQGDADEPEEATEPDAEAQEAQEAQDTQAPPAPQAAPEEAPVDAAPPSPPHTGDAHDDEAPVPTEEQGPFGLAALTEVLRVLVSLMDPQSTRHTMTMRILGLHLLGGLLETHGALIAKFPTLRALLQDSACRYLFQLANTENHTVVAESLRVLSILFDEMRTDLKLQQELFLLFLLQQLRGQVPLVQEPWRTDGKDEAQPVTLSCFRAGSSGEMRELFLESLSLLLDRNGSDAFVELWRNYDCDLHCSNLYEQLVHFLCRSIFSQPLQPSEKARPAFSGLQLVSLDLVLGLIARMAERCEDVADSAQTSRLLAQRSRKYVLAAGAAEFNKKPKDGVAFLEKEQLIDTESPKARARSIAHFLKESPLVDKRLLGDYISRQENGEILTEFMDLFDFRDIDVAEAMRALCEAFRLPGEAQQIARVTETFAAAYFATKPAGIRSEDAVYVLAYSIIMLNTDLHNPQVTRRMTIADYQRNLRGVNDGVDFDADYLATIYDEIRRREIVMPEEHAGQLGFDYTWKELLRKSRAQAPLVDAPPQGLDRALFQHSWRPFVASIAHAFAQLQDEHLLQRVIAGCRQCAVLARAYDVPDVFDYMVHHFAQSTGLLRSPLALDTAANAEHVLDGQTIMISPLSVHFGTNFKSQLAAVVLFTIANGNGGAIRGGWDDILGLFETLLPNGLLPPSVASMRDASLAAKIPIPLKAKKGPMLRAAPAQSGGLFSTLSSYFLSPYGGAVDPMDVGEAEIESSLCTLDCLASCKIEELHAQLANLPDAALGAYADALHRRLQPHLERAEEEALYTPTTLFLLEELAETTTSRPALLDRAGAHAMNACRTLLDKATDRHPLELERSVVNALRLLGTAAREGRPGVRANLAALLEQIQRLPEPLHADISPAVLGALDALLREQRGLLATSAEWQQLARIVATYAKVQRADSARIAFDIARHQLGHACNAASYAALVELARELISTADRALWLNAKEQARRTLTEKRELGDWEEAVQQATLALLPALEHVKGEIPALLQGSDLVSAWPAYWLPLLAALAQQCVNASRLTRQAAVGHLQRVVLAPDALRVAPSPVAPHLEAIFQNILFPLMETLLKPETLRADAHAKESSGETIPVTRVHVCMLLCRAWVHFQAPLAEQMSEGHERFVRLWLGVLRSVVQLLQTHPTDEVDEQLKNMLLVMQAERLLDVGGVGDATWKMVDAVRPDLRAAVQGAAAGAAAPAEEASVPVPAEVPADAPVDAPAAPADAPAAPAADPVDPPSSVS